jgi:hypothetical protein
MKKVLIYWGWSGIVLCLGLFVAGVFFSASPLAIVVVAISLCVFAANLWMITHS